MNTHAQLMEHSLSSTGGLPSGREGKGRGREEEGNSGADQAQIVQFLDARESDGLGL